MNDIKKLEADEQFMGELKAAGEKLVVVYYSAEWCVPCKTIAPAVDVLTKKHPSVVFLKLDVYKCQETAMVQGVTAIPTFTFHKNIEKIDTLEGADPLALEEKIKQHSGGQSEVQVSGHSDLHSTILLSQCECMNESDLNPLANVFEDNESYLQSECDAQLIISVTFQQPVKIHSIRIKAPSENGPKDIKIFINQTETLGFDNGEFNTATQELSLAPTQLDGSPISLLFVKFQNVINIQLYIKNNQNSSDKTIINYLGFIGTPVASTNMGDFTRVSGKKGDSSSKVDLN